MLIKGLTKNHGMYTVRHDNRIYVYVSSRVGLFKIHVPKSESSPWEYEHILNREISDIAVFDIDNYGDLELITIEPFHGDTVSVYTSFNGSWEPIYKINAEFAHIIWCGTILGQSGILIGHRGREQPLTWLYQEEYKISKLKSKNITIGRGPIQVTVVNDKGRDLILCANNGIGEVALYVISA
jgi:hypothetical protein